MRGIAKGVALRLRRIQYVLRIVIFLKKAKYTPNILLIVATILFMLIEYLRKWVELLELKHVKANLIIKGTKYNPRVCNIASIIRKHHDIIDADEQACEILPKSSILVAYSRGANLKELLALSNPYRGVEPVGRGCIT
jgi:hypothetical protein